MTFADGWVCQSCWKPNRGQDTRCYRCKAERGADRAAIESARAEQQARAARAKRVPEVAIGLPATVFAWYGRITIIGGVLLVLVAVLVLNDPTAPEGAFPFWLAFSLGTVAAGAAMRWASGAMRASNPWAFALALVVSLAVVGGTLYAMNSLPSGAGNPNWMRYITISAFGLSAILALVGLLFSLTGDTNDERVDGI